MNIALEGLSSQHEELREYTYSFFCNIAELLLQDFVVYIPSIFPHLLSSIASEDGVLRVDDEDDEDGMISEGDSILFTL